MYALPSIKVRTAHLAADAIMARSRARFGHGAFVMDGLATIDRLEAERREQEDFIDHLLSEAEKAEPKRDLVDAEKANLEAAKKRIKAIDEQLTPLREFAELRDAHRQGGNVRPAGGRREDREERSLGARTEVRRHEYRDAGEFMADAWRAKMHGDEDALKRIQTHGRTIGQGSDAEITVSDIASAREADIAYVASLSAEKRASAPNVTTVEIPGAMPVSVVGPLLNDLDDSRPFLNSVGVKDLAGIPGKTFTRPVVTTHVSMGTQSSEKTAVQAGQFKIDDVDFTKSTEGGYVDVSRQSIDWSSPAMWTALLTDFVAEYGIWTENKAADAWLTAVQTGTAVDTDITGSPTLVNYITSLYNAAVQVYTLSHRMPNHVWMSLDVWAALGILLDTASASAAGQDVGRTDVSNFNNGGILTLPRTVVPSLASATIVVGRTDRYEAYEERLGFLSAVEPKLLGVELAYGGYFAANVLNVDAFAEITYS